MKNTKQDLCKINPTFESNKFVNSNFDFYLNNKTSGSTGNFTFNIINEFNTTPLDLSEKKNMFFETFKIDEKSKIVN